MTYNSQLIEEKANAVLTKMGKTEKEALIPWAETCMAFADFYTDWSSHCYPDPADLIPIRDFIQLHDKKLAGKIDILITYMERDLSGVTAWMRAIDAELFNLVQMKINGRVANTLLSKLVTSEVLQKIRKGTA